MCTRIKWNEHSPLNCHTHVFECLVFLYNNNVPTYACNKCGISIEFFFLTFALVIWEAWACKIGDSRLIFPFAKLVFFCGQLSYAASCLVGFPVDCLESCFSFSCLDLGNFSFLLKDSPGSSFDLPTTGGVINAFEAIKSRSKYNIFEGNFSCIRHTKFYKHYCSLSSSGGRRGTDNFQQKKYLVLAIIFGRARAPRTHTHFNREKNNRNHLFRLPW